MTKEPKQLEFKDKPSRPFVLTRNIRKLALSKAKEQLALELSEAMHIPLIQAHILVKSATDLNRNIHNYEGYKSAVRILEQE